MGAGRAFDSRRRRWHACVSHCLSSLAHPRRHLYCQLVSFTLVCACASEALKVPTARRSSCDHARCRGCCRHDRRFGMPADRRRARHAARPDSREARDLVLLRRRDRAAAPEPAVDARCRSSLRSRGGAAAAATAIHKPFWPLTCSPWKPTFSTTAPARRRGSTFMIMGSRRRV